jgi:hypothetical protein
MDKNDSSRKIISFYPHRSIFLALFDEIFMFYLKKKHALAVSFFLSYFANDEKQLQIILFYWFSTCMLHSSVGMLTLR